MGTRRLGVSPFHLVQWMSLLVHPTMELTGGIQRQRRQRHVDPGIVIEMTLELTPSRQESTAVKPRASWDVYFFKSDFAAALAGPAVMSLLLKAAFLLGQYSTGSK
jgi:hypothetical protein